MSDNDKKKPGCNAHDGYWCFRALYPKEVDDELELDKPRQKTQ